MWVFGTPGSHSTTVQVTNSGSFKWALPTTMQCVEPHQTDLGASMWLGVYLRQPGRTEDRFDLMPGWHDTTVEANNIWLG